MGALSKVKNMFGGGSAVFIALEVVSKLLNNKTVSDEAKKIEMRLNDKAEIIFSEYFKSMSEEIKALKTVVRVLFVSVVILIVLTLILGAGLVTLLFFN